ncbi:MAG: hypothetical protein WEA56_15475 [Balneolaceae bacterium]
MKSKETKLQHFEFGDQPDDHFYCLIDLNITPVGINIEELKLTDPRRLDLEFRENGCLMLITGSEIKELVQRGELDESNLHQSLYNLAVKEGVIRKTEP